MNYENLILCYADGSNLVVDVRDSVVEAHENNTYFRVYSKTPGISAQEYKIGVGNLVKVKFGHFSLKIKARK